MAGRQADAQGTFVPPVILAGLMQFYDTNARIQRAATIKAQAVFSNASNTWSHPLPFANFWEGEQADSSAAPVLFNSEYFLREQQHFLTRVGDYLTVCGACTIWIVADRGRWVRDIMNAETDAARADVGMPFGVAEARHFVWTHKPEKRRIHQSRLVAEPLDPAAARVYDYFVYNDGLHLLPLSAATLDDMVDYYAGEVGELGQQELFNRSTPWKEEMRMPRSPFYDLREQAARLDEATLCTRNANANVAFPVPQLTATAPPANAVDPMLMSDRDVFSTRSMQEAAVGVTKRQNDWSLGEAQRYLTNLKRQLNPRRRADEPTLGMRFRQHYKLSNPIEDAHPYPDNLTMAAWKEPHVIIDVELLETRLGESIASIMGVPITFLTGTSNGAHANMAAAQLRGQLEHTVDQERLRYETITRTVFQVAFGEFALATINDALVLIDAAREHTLAQIKKKAIVPMLTSNDAMDVDTEDTEGDDAESERVRVTAAGMRTFLERLRGHRGGPQVVLAFSREPTIRGNERLKIVLALYAQKMVTWESVADVAKDVLGRTMTFVKPPAPPKDVDGKPIVDPAMDTQALLNVFSTDTM